jgi:hypothetical protein
MSKFLFFLYYVSFFSFSSVFNLEQNEPLLYAAESIVASDYNDDGHLIISSASDTLNISFKAGFGLSSDFRYVRIDVTNGAFNTSFAVGGLAASDAYSSVLAAGGNTGDQYAVVELSASPSVGQNTLLILEADSFSWFDISEPLDIRYTLFDTATTAVNNLDFLYSVEATLAKVVTAVGENFAHSFTHTAGFNQDFLRFNSTFRSPATFALGDATATLASMGKILFSQLITDNVLMPSTSIQINDFRSLIPASNSALDSVIITGDFSAVNAFLNADDDCVGASFALASYSDVNTVQVSIDNLFAFPVLCLSTDSNTVLLNRSVFEIDMELGFESHIFGELTYDAASIDLPYITSYQLYRQRILLVNHTGFDVAYTTRFIAEPGVVGHYTEGAAASGIIRAGSTLKIRGDDLVNIDTGVPSRIAARIFVDAKPEDISAAIQILSIGSLEPPTTNVLSISKY